MSHEEERASGARMRNKPERAPPHWLNPSGWTQIIVSKPRGMHIGLYQGRQTPFRINPHKNLVGGNRQKPTVSQTLTLGSQLALIIYAINGVAIRVRINSDILETVGEYPEFVEVRVRTIE
jgi:hypothetical protein